MYLFGYKAEISEGSYFEALSEIQRAELSNESKVFVVNNGQKEERQYKAKWRHERGKNSPLLGPTKGWVKVPLNRITTIKESQLGKALEESENNFASIFNNEVEPVLCDTPEKLNIEVENLRKNIGDKTPVGQKKPLKKTATRSEYVRDAAVVAYAFNRAKGVCESCLEKSPFLKTNNEPYLEVHHLKRLSDGGSDQISNVVAICPNCHRELHSGINKKKLLDKVYSNNSNLIKE
ncbi:MAG: hypothetical protein GQ532_16600 [Methylomarinum sp.]|nr:hypothetical protein [Methylomarinum sp.]